MWANITKPFLTSIDYPGHLALFIPFCKCNLKCKFCHNKHLWTDDNFMETNEVLNQINMIADFIDAVVISGGEPLMQFNTVIELAQQAKRNDLKVKINTNLTYPTFLGAIFDNVEIDYIAGSLKSFYFNDPVYTHKVRESVKIIQDQKPKPFFEACIVEEDDHVYELVEEAAELFADLISIQPPKLRPPKEQQHENKRIERDGCR